MPSEPDDIDCDYALQCLYSLSELDKKVLDILRLGDEFRSKEIAGKLDRDQSTAYRSLEKLVWCGFVYKERHNIRKGGYYFTYSARPLDMIKKETLEYLDKWYEGMKKAIDEL